MSLLELRKAAGLRMTDASVSRKLGGSRPISAAEIAAFAGALGLAVDLTPEAITVAVAPEV